MKEAINKFLWKEKEIVADDVDDPSSIAFDKTIYDARRKGYLNPEGSGKDIVEVCQAAIKKQTRDYRPNKNRIAK